MADVVFIVRGVQFWSHSAIWTFSSPVVADLLETSNFDEGYESVHVDDLEPEAFRLLIRYLHTGELDNLDVITAESLLKVASRYQIEDVKRICEEVLADAIDSNNVVRHLLAAYLNKAIDLFESALDFVAENKDEIFNSPDMKHLMDEYPELFALIQREIRKGLNLTK